MKLDDILDLLVEGVDALDEGSVFVLGFEEKIKDLIVFEVELFEVILELAHKEIDLALSIFCLGWSYRKRIIFFDIDALDVEALTGENDGTLFAVKKHVVALAADELVSGCFLRVVDAAVVTFGVGVQANVFVSFSNRLIH